MRKIIWKPYGDYLKCRVADFMQRHGIKNYEELVRRSTEDIEWFWDAALKHLGVEWYKPYNKVLEGWMPWAKWFVGGRINIVHNCLDRHIRDGKGNVRCIVWEGDDGSVREHTYDWLNREVCRAAAALRSSGVKRGDTVGIYMPMVPEIAVAMFATMKIGAIPIPVFSGFGPGALAARLADARAKALFTADGGFRRGEKIPIKPNADEALKTVPSVQRVIVLRHTNTPVNFDKNRDVWWDDFLKGQPIDYPTEEMESEDYALIIYTSGTTGKPKGTVHTHGGCLAQIAKELGYAFDVQPNRLFFWLTDIGWMMGPWEMIGVQFFGGTYMMFEGAPNWPTPDRLWQMVERHKIDTLGISPTVVRLLAPFGKELPAKHDLSSLRILGSTGEPWDDESYLWFFENVGGGRCPIINISGGTEIVGCHLSPLPICELKPSTLRGPGLGMDVDCFSDEGKPVRGGIGHLVCKKPAPSMTRGFLNDPQRYLDTYFSRFGEKIWFHGDWAEVDEDGFWFLHGRSDDTIKVAGKRVGPAEIEAVLIENDEVVEAAAIGVPEPVKGEEIVVFVVLKQGVTPTEELRKKLREHIGEVLGKTMRPKEVKFVKAIPKTRSAKIVRGTIKRKYLGQPLGDISSIENPDALDALDHAI
ncbi:MAG: AMP-binding protein [Planctomycetota bacterium]|nr:AMP-binding protein [Planctomycetota bacterium]